ncbi:reverse transcriptase domain-containing protein [Tanacetum coccineum]
MPPLSIWKELNIPALTKTQMILELIYRTISTATGIAEDVFVKVGTFFFPVDFVVIDYVADPRVPLILGRPFLRTALGDTKTISYNIIESVNRVDVIDIACEEYVQEVLEISKSGNLASSSDLMIDSRSPSFTPFGGSDFLMEEIDAFLEHDDSIPPGVDGIYDSEGDTLFTLGMLSNFLSVINNGTDKTGPDQGFLRTNKTAIAWKITDIKGIDPQFFTHKILMKEYAKLVVQHQRRVNPKIHEDQKLKDYTEMSTIAFWTEFSGYFQIPMHHFDQVMTTLKKLALRDICLFIGCLLGYANALGNVPKAPILVAPRLGLCPLKSSIWVMQVDFAVRGGPGGNRAKPKIAPVDFAAQNFDVVIRDTKLEQKIRREIPF